MDSWGGTVEGEDLGTDIAGDVELDGVIDDGEAEEEDLGTDIADDAELDSVVDDGVADEVKGVGLEDAELAHPNPGLD